MQQGNSAPHHFFAEYLMSARFVRFCGRQTICLIRLARAPCAGLMLAPGQIFAQLLGRTRLALSLLPLGPVSGPALPARRHRFVRQIIVMIVHARTNNRKTVFSTALGYFCPLE